MRDDTEQSAPHLKRTQVGDGSFIVGGDGNRSQRPKNLALQDVVYGCTEDQTQWNLEELLGVLTGGDNICIALIEQEQKAMTLDAAGNANWLVFALLG
jgi:hypothetical protein